LSALEITTTIEFLLRGFTRVQRCVEAARCENVDLFRSARFDRRV
jgi:hypothetical protein